MLRARALIAVALVALLAGCSTSPSTPVPAPAQSTNFGDVIGRSPLTEIDPAVADASSSSLRVTYVSNDAVNDSHQHATASVYVPTGAAPPTGFPIVALGRSVTGTGRGCSSLPTAGDDSPTILALLRAGYLVVAPDYLSLGRPSDEGTSSYPFLDSATGAENTIDAVRAARVVVPQTSTSWVVLGNADGGQAAWAVNELADDYGYGATLRGTVSISPVADIEGLADAAAAGTLTREQDLAYIAYVNALSTEYPNDFHLDDYRRGIVSQNWDLLLSCDGGQADARASVTEQITPDDLRPGTPDALATLRGYLRKTTLPQGPTVAPMLVSFGPGDLLVPAAWTDRALQRACGMGDVITIRRQPDGSPPSIDSTTALGWIADRFAGTTAPNDCAQVRAKVETPVSAPNAAPVAPPAPQSALPDEVGNPGTSLISGWLPTVIQVVAFAVLLIAIGWRSRRWRVRSLPVAGVAGVVIAAVAYSYVDYQGWGEDPPWSMWAWIAIAGLAIAVAVLGWPDAPWWRRLVSVLAVPLAVMSAADVLNVSLGYVPTVRTAWEMATGEQPSDWIDEARLAAMVRDGVRPDRGTVVSVDIPDDRSGFAHRRELVYLPPAWFETSPPPRLPTIMMISTEMGRPSDWLQPGDGLRILDDFALKHRGVTPVGVFVDSSGTFDNDTECVNGSRGNAADHLIKDVPPYVISHFGVSGEPSNWGVLGFSTGGTCALTLSVMHPETFSAFVDLDGDVGPNAGGKNQTIDRLFGGDANAWAAFDPKSVVEAHGRYANLAAWLAVSGHTPTVYRPSASNTPVGEASGNWKLHSVDDHAANDDQLCQLLSGHGIECSVSSYPGAHDFPSAARGFAAALPWLAGQLNTPGTPRLPLPGAPSTD